jgi:pilus assembly protein CpaB
MKPKQMMLFAFAIGCGLVAMIGAQSILSGNKAPEQEMVEILVAKTDIDPGIPLDDMNVGLRKWPKDTVPEGAITSKEQWAEHALKIRATQNMPVLIPYLGPKGAVGITSMIPTGMELISLPVDSTQTHSGLLRAGSYVSIKCTIEREPSTQLGGNRQKTTQIKTVLKRAKVMAVGNQVAGTEEAKKDSNAPKVENVSFVVFPQQAKLLMLAKAVSKGQIHISILPEGDKSTEDSRDLDDADLARRESDLLGNSKPDVENVVKDEIIDEKPKGSSFSDYLKDQVVAPEVAELGKEPTRTTWRIEIYKGDKKEIQEVEMTKEPTAASTSSTGPEVGSDWAAPIMKFFSRKRSVQPSVQDTKSTRSDDEQPELPSEKNARSPVETSRQ